MNRQHYLETIEAVLAWDLPDEALADAIHQQFAYMTNLTGDIDIQYAQELASLKKLFISRFKAECNARSSIF